MFVQIQQFLRCGILVNSVKLCSSCFVRITAICCYINGFIINAGITQSYMATSNVLQHTQDDILLSYLLKKKLLRATLYYQPKAI